MSCLKNFSKIALSILFSLEVVYAAPLITAKEAALPPATKVVTRGISRGPAIKLVFWIKLNIYRFLCICSTRT